MISNMKRQRTDESSIQLNNDEILSNFFKFHSVPIFSIGIQQKCFPIFPLDELKESELGKALAFYLITNQYLLQITFINITTFSFSFWQPIFSFLSSNQHLKYISFLHCRFPFPHQVLCLSNLIRYNKGLKTLELSHYLDTLSNDQRRVIFDAIYDSTTLTDFKTERIYSGIDYRSLYQGSCNSAFYKLHLNLRTHSYVKCERIFAHPSSANIRSLSLPSFFNNLVQSASFARFLPILTTVTTLEELDLSNNFSFNDEQNKDIVLAFLKSLVINPTLLNLNLSGVRFVSNECQHTVSEIIAKNNTLVDFNFRFNFVSTEIETQLGQAIGFNSTLKKLDLSSNCLSGQKFGIALVESLKRNQTLSELLVENNFLSSKKFLSGLGDALAVNDSLKSLSLQQINSHGEIGQLFEFLSLNNGMKLLDLSKNVFNLQSVAALKKFLSSNTSLQKLNLASTKMTTEMVTLVVDALCANQSLKKVNLSDNHVTQLHIETIIRHNSSLSNLTITETNEELDLNIPSLMNALLYNNSMQSLMLDRIYTSFGEIQRFGDFLSQKPNLKKIMFSASEFLCSNAVLRVFCKNYLSSHYCIQQIPVKTLDYQGIHSKLDKILLKNAFICKRNKVYHQTSLFNLLLPFLKFTD